MLPILDIVEGLIIGDASLLSSRVIIDKPKIKPRSITVDISDEWSNEKNN